MVEGRFFFRVLELERGRWECRRGRFAIDEHDAYGEAIGHVAKLARAEAPSSVYVHRLDRTVEWLITFA